MANVSDSTLQNLVHETSMNDSEYDKKMTDKFILPLNVLICFIARLWPNRVYPLG